MTTFGGYTCSACGNWVSFGSIHSCPSRIPPAPAPAPPLPIQLYTFSPVDLSAVLAVLERIAEALEALNL